MCIVFAFNSLQAQSIAIGGKLADSNNMPIEAASIYLLNIDSSFVAATSSDNSGRFRINEIKAYTKYALKIVAMGYQTYVRSIQTAEIPLKLGIITLNLNTASLNQVTISAKLPIAILNGDTTSYSASAFKVNKDATAEDLVTKMPGVIITDGKVQAQGEDVKQVLVDGKVFFGDDANAVLKNIPAEVIDKIQVFDKKSDQAQFTGVDDGNTAKTINIVTKPQFRNGTFGKAFIGYGDQGRYRMGGNINIFKGNRRITILTQANDVNEQNFTADDLAGVMSSSGGQGGGGHGHGGMRGGQGGPGGQSNNADNFIINTQNGINSTGAFGVNYADKWGKKTDVSGSYFFNQTKNESSSNLLQQYLLNNTKGLIYSETNVADNTNLNNRFNFKIETKIDSFNSIVFQPKVSFQQNDGSKTLFGQNIKSLILLSKTNNNSSNRVFSYMISAPILYRHAFSKRGRTFSVNVSPTFSLNNSESKNNANNVYYNDTSFTGDTVDQQIKNLKNGNGVIGNIVYTEPISKLKFLSFSYSSSYSQNYSSRKTFTKDPLLQDTYTVIDTLLTSIFKNDYQTQSGGIGFRYQKEKINIAINAAYQWAQLNKQQEFPSYYSLGRTFQSLLPSAQLQYKITAQKTLRINYRSSNNAPSIDQLQNVINNSNSLQLSTGNPYLKQDFQHSLNIRYSKVDTKKANSFFALLNGNYATNYIGNSTLIASRDTVVYTDVILPRGSQIQRPVNLQGYFSLRSFVNYTVPIKKIKTNFSVNATVAYSNVPGMINEEKNIANTTTGILGFIFTSNISDKVDFTIASNSTYSNVNNTLQKSTNNVYFIETSKFKITMIPIKNIVLQSEFTYSSFSGLSSAFNQSIALWNTGVGCKFLKKQQGEIRISVYDLLNQNKSIQRTNTESYIQDLQTNILQRYYLLTVTYTFKTYSTNPKQGIRIYK